MADSQAHRLELPFFKTDLGRSVARRSWQKLMRKEIRSEVDDGQTGSYKLRIRVAGEQIHPIANRRYVIRALTCSPSLLRGTRRRIVWLAEIRKIRAHQPRIGRHPIAEGRVRGQRQNHVHHVVAEAAAVKRGKAE